MLVKLAYRNAKRSLKDYLIYLITITISFSLLLAFNLVASSDSVISLSSGMDLFKTILTFVNIVIVFVICFLINYTTKFIFEKRSKELGTYMLLGIRKKEIIKMFLIENIILGFIALLISIPIGFILSQFISLAIIKILDIPKAIFITIDFEAIGWLVIYFLAIYLLVLINMLHKIKKMTIYNFIYLEKQNEKKMFHSSKKRNIVFVVSLLIGVVSLIHWNSLFYLDSYENINTPFHLVISLIGLIFSIYGISTTCADMFLSFLLKSKRLKYQKDNLFVARTFASKARTMGFAFGTLSMLILLSILSLNFSIFIKGIYQSSIDLNAPYDICIYDDKQAFHEYINVIKEDFTINKILEYDIYREPKNQIGKFFKQYGDFDSVIKLSDYNCLLEMRKMNTVTLRENEYLIVTSRQIKNLIDNYDAIEWIQLSSGDQLRLKGIHTESFWYTLSIESWCVMVVPDTYVAGMDLSESHLIVDTEENTNASLQEKIWNDLSHRVYKTDDDGDIINQYYRVIVRGAVIEEQNSVTAIMASICMYITFILISVVGTILAIQSLSDATKYKYRYVTLRRLGVNDPSLYKTIRKQLFILFGMPTVYSVICSFFMLTSMNKTYQLLLENRFTYLLYFAGSLASFFMIYAIYWITTYIGFKRNINEES